MSATPHVEIPSAHPRHIRHIDAYGLEVVWIGPRYETGASVVMLVTSADRDPIESAVVLEAHTEGSILVLAVDPARGEVAASACVVACYRWLLAQLVGPDDVLIVAHEDLGGVARHLTERLRNSGDALPSGVMVMDRLGARDLSPIWLSARAADVDGVAAGLPARALGSS